MRVSTLVSAAIVLLIAWLASRTRVDVGVALAILGLVLAYARRMLAVPVVGVIAAAVCAPALLYVLAFVAVAVGLLYGFGSVLLGWGGAPTSGSTSGGGWYGLGWGDFGDGGDGDGGCG